MPKYEAIWTNQFKKDYKLLKKRGYNLEKLHILFSSILNGEVLDPKYGNHPLKGEWIGCQDAHISPDWIMIYEIDEENRLVKLWRTGTHSDLLGM
jgi:mRNA interferase YafQ